jgi:hypothetical protein
VKWVRRKKKKKKRNKEREAQELRLFQKSFQSVESAPDVVHVTPTRRFFPSTGGFPPAQNPGRIIQNNVL